VTNRTAFLDELGGSPWPESSDSRYSNVGYVLLALIVDPTFKLGAGDLAATAETTFLPILDARSTASS